MATSITFFPVDNGDMTLICLGDKAGTTILIDCNIQPTILTTRRATLHKTCGSA